MALLAPMLTAAREARADGPKQQSARIDVDAPAECATEATFWKALARRTDRVAQAEKKAATARIEVSIKKERASSVVGEITIARSGTRSERRRIAGATCEEVTMGLSLVAALAFDPAARVDVEPEPAPAPAPSASTTEPPKNELGSPAPTSPEPVQNARIAPVASAEGPQPPPATSAWRLGIGALGGVSALGTTNATLSYGGFFDLENDRMGLAPSFRAGVKHAEGSADGGLAAANLAWTVGAASACPLRLDLVSKVAFRPCAGLDAGVLSASATGIAKTNDRSRLWLAPNAVMRLSWSPARVLFVEIQGGASVPLVRDEFAVDPSVSVYRAPSVVPIGEIAAGARFW